MQKELDTINTKYAQFKTAYEVATQKSQTKSQDNLNCPICAKCPTCQKQNCPPCRPCLDHSNATVSLHTPCWGNTPLYQPGFECEQCQHTVEEYPWAKPAELCGYVSLGGCCKWRHFLGFSYYRSAQLGWGDIMMLDFALSAHQNLKNIVEFGTLVGITSMYLGTIAKIRGGNLITFDIQEHRHQEIKNNWPKHMKYYLTDLMKARPDKQVLKAVQQNNTFYFF